MSLTGWMGDCVERTRISQEISKAIRDEIRVRRHATEDPVQSMSALRSARENLRRLKAEYRTHIAEHGCLPRDEKFTADAGG